MQFFYKSKMTVILSVFLCMAMLFGDALPVFAAMENEVPAVNEAVIDAEENSLLEEAEAGLMAEETEEITEDAPIISEENGNINEETPDETVGASTEVFEEEPAPDAEGTTDPEITFTTSAHSITMKIHFSDAFKESLKNTIGMQQVYLHMIYSTPDAYEKYLYLKFTKAEEYADQEITMDKLLSGAEYTFKLSGNPTYGIEDRTFLVKTPDDPIKAELSVKNPHLGGGGYVLKLTEGYNPAKSYQARVYYDIGYQKKVNPGGLLTLDASNDFTVSSDVVFMTEPASTYDVYGEVITEEGKILLPHILYETGKVKDFLEVEVNNISGTTANLYIKIKDFTLLGTDSSKVSAMANTPITGGDESNWIKYIGRTPVDGTVTKDDPDINLPLCYLAPGNTYNIRLSFDNGVDVDADATFTTPAIDQTFAPFTGVERHTKQEIINKWNSLDIDMDMKDVYKEPVDQKWGGVLTDDCLQNVTDALNFVRYCCGVPADVIYDTGCSYLANCGAEINRLRTSQNKGLSHTPELPDAYKNNMDFYYRAYTGSSMSNLSYRSWKTNIMSNFIGWMRDSGSNNLVNGHRHWNLRPAETVVGWGKSGTTAAEFVNNSGTEREMKAESPYFYSWPAEYTPIEFYGDFYDGKDYSTSVYYGGGYEIKDQSAVTVTINNKTQKKTWTLTKADTYSKNKQNYLNVASSQIIFQVDPFKNGDEVDVKIEGFSVNDVPQDIEYTMHFFSLAGQAPENVPVESLSISADSYTVAEGDTLKLKASVLPLEATNKKVTWSVESGDGKGEATIDESGVLFAKLAGKVKVTCTSQADSSIKATCEVTIVPENIPLTSLKLSEEAITLEVGAKHYLRVIPVPYNATNIKLSYESTDPSKIQVEEGWITALAETEDAVSIIVSAGEISATCLVSCKENAAAYDRYYFTRLSDIQVEGSTEFVQGDKTILKVYPVSTRDDITKDEYKLDFVAGGKCISWKEIASTDNGTWYEVEGIAPGKETVTLQLSANIEGASTEEKLVKKVPITVLKENVTDEDAFTQIILGSANAVINQNLELGAKLDIRTIVGNGASIAPILSSDDGSHALFKVTKQGADYYIQTKELIKNSSYKLKVTLQDSTGKKEYPLTVKVNNQFPTVSVKQNVAINTTLAAEKAILTFTGNEPIGSVKIGKGNLDFAQLDEQAGEHSRIRAVTIGQKSHGEKIDKVLFADVYFEGYRFARQVKVSLKTTSKAVPQNFLGIDKKSVTLNTNETAAEGTFYVKLQNSAKQYPDKMVLSSKDGKSAVALREKKLMFTYNKYNGCLKAYGDATLAAASYKFDAIGYIEDGSKREKVNNAVVITIAVNSKAPAVKLKASGSLDLLCRKESYFTVKPQITNVDGKVINVTMDSDNGKLFYTKMCDDGSFRIYAREWAGVIAKQKYNLKFALTLNNGVTFKDVPLVVTPIQSNLTVSYTNKILLYKKQNEVTDLNITVKKPVFAQIDSIKVVSVPKGIGYKDGGLYVSDPTMLKTGKTYTVELAVTPKQAYRVVKPVKVKVKVTIK